MGRVLSKFDFTNALKLSCSERFDASLFLAQSHVQHNGYQTIFEFPCIPNCGATETEISKLELELGTSLPEEYRDFLKKYRYLKIDDGCEIAGLDIDGIFITGRPWTSDKHKLGLTHLVFANYWLYADGDQLMFDLSLPEMPIVAYLHEFAGLIEYYAPSFSLALWRMVHEL